MFQVELHTGEIPDLFQRFQREIGESTWLNVKKSVDEEAARTPILRPHLEHENRLALALSRCSEAVGRRPVLPLQLASDPSLYEAFTFVAQSLGLIAHAHQFSMKRARALRRRIQVAFDRPEDVQAMQLEWAVATHFRLAGQEVQWPEIEPGRKEKFDILIPTLGAGVEVECKLITKNKGRKVHRKDAISVLHLLISQIGPLLSGWSNGLAIVITLSERLTGASTQHEHLVDSVRQAVLGSGIATKDLFVRLVDFDKSKFDPRSPEFRQHIDALTGTKNREASVFSTPAGGVAIFILQSALADSLKHELRATLQDAACRQLTATRPGLLVAGFDDLAAQQLRAIAADDRSGAGASIFSELAVELLAPLEHAHLVGLCFLSVLEVKVGQGTDRQFGTAFSFPNVYSTFWDEGYRNLFSTSGQK